MLIELTDKSLNKKIMFNTVLFLEIYVENSDGSTTIEQECGTNLRVKETPQQIQEMILLDEFAKIAMGGILSNSNHAMSSDDASQEAYAIAKSMIEARREALK